MKLALLLLLASVGCLALLYAVSFLVLVFEMNQWQGALLGIAMWSLVIATATLSVVGIRRGVKAFKNRCGVAQAR